ncbi:DnaB-like helicase N-terminal domain-containing protein [Singulisphaera sp. PoT]|uniref:DnaB-like helicase N-terminal domain-containing protein n=1 Tax=Singulisphaera sp. PoT TaxID=3411797 RepID=UPI003BF529C0
MGFEQRNGHYPADPNGHFASIARLNPSTRGDVESLINVPAEAGVLAALLRDPERWPEVSAIVSSGDFFRPDHAVIFRLMADLAKHGRPIDIVAVADAWVDLGCGAKDATDRLAEILDSIAHCENTVYHATIVAEKSRKREAAELAEEASRALLAGHSSVADILDVTLDKLKRLRDRTLGTVQDRSAFAVDFVDSKTFFDRAYPVDWLISNLLVRGEPAAIGGPMKTLKTSILIDAMVSLSTATQFLGWFPVPKPIRCGLISGESGRRSIQRSALEICRARGISPSEADLLWGFNLPRLNDPSHLQILRKTIVDNGLEVLGLDPLYLMLISDKTDAANMFDMGAMFKDVTDLCLGEGCTPLLAHHFVKSRVDPFAPPELNEFAYAGLSQFLRQWLLLSPREAYEPERGLFRLHFRYGGSAGHSGELAIDIEVGKLTSEDDTRKWQVSVSSPSQQRDAQAEAREEAARLREVEKEERKREKAERSMAEWTGEAIKLLEAAPNRAATVKTIREELGWKLDRANPVIGHMKRLGLIVPVQVATPMNGGRFQNYPGYQLVEDHELLL